MGGFVRKTVGSLTGSTAAGEAAQAGAATSAASQREALEYLKQKEALPQQFREAGLTDLAGLYGLEGGSPDALARLERSPMYEAVMSGQGAGEEAIMRNAAMTGGLRSGDVQSNFMDFNSQLQNQAMLQGISGLQGMSQLPSNANQIAQGMTGIGNTLAQGQIAAGSSAQAGMGMVLNAGAQAAKAFSDARLKRNVVSKGKRNGHEWFSWIWNERAKELGLEGKGEGVIADKVAQYMPEAVTEYQGYKTVDYSMLGV